MTAGRFRPRREWLPIIGVILAAGWPLPFACKASESLVLFIFSCQLGLTPNHHKDSTGVKLSVKRILFTSHPPDRRLDNLVHESKNNVLIREHRRLGSLQEVTTVC